MMDEATILIIEDDPVTRGLLEGILRVAHFRTLSAGDAIEGVHASRGRRPDLIVLDLMLPGIDGRTAAEAFMSDSRYARVPIVLLSASPDLETVARSIGAADWMAKPFNPARLVRTIRNLLERRTASRLIRPGYLVNGAG